MPIAGCGSLAESGRPAESGGFRRMSYRPDVLKWAVSPPSEALGACRLPGDVWQSAPRCRGRAVGDGGEAQGKSRAEGAGPADELRRRCRRRVLEWEDCARFRFSL